MVNVYYIRKLHKENKISHILAFEELSEMETETHRNAQKRKRTETEFSINISEFPEQKNLKSTKTLKIF